MIPAPPRLGPFLLVAILLGSSPNPAPADDRTPAVEPAGITVEPGPRQVFAGFGTSLGNWGRDYQKLAPAERDRLARLLWRDLGMTTLRLWINLDEFAPGPEPSRRTIADFRARYLDSGIVADARALGMTHLLLAPDAMPAHLKLKRAGGPADFVLKEDAIPAYADLIAEFLATVRDQAGVTFEATGIQNEPNDLDRITPAQMVSLVKALRRALDARGLASVAIVAPEAANVDGIYLDTIARLKADPAAWAALGGVASHSYGMGSTAASAAQIAGPDGRNLRPSWMTESSDNGPEAPGDAVRSAMLASRFLGDLNNRTTHWVHFLGFEAPDPRDDGTRILAYTPGPLRMTIFHKFYAYQQLSRAFPPGSVARRCRSTLGSMDWTYGKKPALSAAAAVAPDGTWAVGLSNFTSTSFRDDPDDNAGRSARTFEVTVTIPELAGTRARPFALRRTGPHLTDATEGQLSLIDGRATVRLGPLELVTLREVGPRQP